MYGEVTRKHAPSCGTLGGCYMLVCGKEGELIALDCLGLGWRGVVFVSWGPGSLSDIRIVPSPSRNASRPWCWVGRSVMFLFDCWLAGRFRGVTPQTVLGIGRPTGRQSNKNMTDGPTVYQGSGALQDGLTGSPAKVTKVQFVTRPVRPLTRPVRPKPKASQPMQINTSQPSLPRPLQARYLSPETTTSEE
ncbi:hypothetical protein F2Q69_00007285 [Brassica cretica]|uniref:Uncharacterized protein n=1 Tax=Brassica cretica TaxID=69181 RepID=A0A8S9PG12_BRACR|nr:hypothetical protein F2Q69_00007285 [Brassica cretica]